MTEANPNAPVLRCFQETSLTELAFAGFLNSNTQKKYSMARPSFVVNVKRRLNCIAYFTEGLLIFCAVSTTGSCIQARIRFAMSVRPHGTTRETLNVFPRNLTLRGFTEIVYKFLFLFPKISESNEGHFTGRP
jgi:hypothetical protein